MTLKSKDVYQKLKRVKYAKICIELICISIRKHWILLVHTLYITYNTITQKNNENVFKSAP